MRPPRFHVGQAVVCLGPFPDATPGLPLPERGRVYHITNMYWSVRFGQWGLQLAEMGPAYGYGEDSFAPVELARDEAVAALVEEALQGVGV